MSKQTKRKKLTKAEREKLTPEELAKVNAGYRGHQETGGYAWQANRPYIEDYSTGVVGDRRRPRD